MNEKNRVAFRAPKALRKLLYLTNQNVTKEWTMPFQNWANIVNQSAIRFQIPCALGVTCLTTTFATRRLLPEKQLAWTCCQRGGLSLGLGSVGLNLIIVKPAYRLIPLEWCHSPRLRNVPRT